MVTQLESKPWHDKGAFRFCALLEANFPRIKAELMALKAEPAAFGKVGGRAVHDSSLVTAGEWREFALFGNQRKFIENCQRCPVTTWCMEQVPEAIELAMAGGGETLFSVLKPGTHLRPHCGSTNARLTCHLGMVIPDGCWIRCGKEKRVWKEGECLVFDDSWEHEVLHQGSADRIVLLINFWHPGLPKYQRRIDTDYGGYEPV